ncbi:FG-GAP-like repeat-containing protein [Rhodopirellula bahusiensis]|uniref:FG-GAP-like repeat-containing protein n=3 Tax=Rhodopirellula bahusiensis TaxID=2014065 RepID=UPI0032977150
MIGCNSKPATDQAEVKPPRVTDTIEPDQTSGTSDSTTRLKPEQVAETAPESFQVDRVQNLIQAGDFEAAGKVLHQHLVANPNDPVALFTLAQLHAASDDLETAIKTLRHPAIEESDAALPALGTTADWLVQLGRSEEAADCYRRMLQVAPDAVMIHRRLASLMIRTGRPPLAQASLRQLCRSGNIQRPELAALISISQADSDRPIGPVAEARRLAKQHDYQGAVDQLAARSETEYQTPDVSAFQTRMLAETQQDKMVAKRLVQGRVEQKAYSDYWAALGIHSLRRKDVETAITAFSNAIAIDPTDASSLQRLSQAYRTWGDVESADRLHKQFRRVLKTIRLSNQIAASPSEVTAIEDLADALDSLDRRLEAVLWRTIAASHQPDAGDNIQTLQTQFTRLAESDDAFPFTPLPETLQVPTSIATEEPDNVSKRHRWMASRQSGVWPAPPTTASWRNVAADVGLDHQFRVAKTPQSKAFSIYQSLGGGVAAIDYDLDGRCDLYCAQGAGDPPEFRSDEPNPLYRNTGEKVTDFSHLAGTGETTYTVGVTAGDWNQDGFDDLAVNQFGSIVLLTNCADGTFRRDVLLSKPTTWLPSSIAISDVNADGLQDLIALAYADSEGIWKKPPVNEEGRPTYLIGPASFSGAANLALLGTSTGWETDFGEIRTPEAPVADTSLGLIIGLNLKNRHSEPNDTENQVNSIFIGNDQQNDRLWTHSNPTANAWTETAMVHGCAFGSFGNPSASMGIAAADFNQDGHDDLHITNFQDEPASLFYGCRSGFRDHSIGSGLHRHSFSVLGFGTAALDFDLNGLPDLMVTNGYIDDPAEQDQPYEQPMQLLVRQDKKYRLQTVMDPSGYWAKPHVGRAMARLDFDGDGRDDVAITNLTETSAILVNQTDTLHHWIRLALVGKDSPRNAIGAAITVVAGERTFSHRVTAGDGFLCRDQPAMTIGLGNHSEDVSIEVRWPNGHTQRWDDVSIDSAWLLTESDSLPFQMPPF